MIIVCCLQFGLQQVDTEAAFLDGPDINDKDVQEITAAFDSITLTKGAYEELLEEMRNDKEKITKLIRVRACTHSPSDLHVSDRLWHISF